LFTLDYRQVEANGWTLLPQVEAASMWTLLPQVEAAGWTLLPQVEAASGWPVAALAVTPHPTSAVATTIARTNPRRF